MRSTANLIWYALRQSSSVEHLLPLSHCLYSTSNGVAVIFSAFKTYDTQDHNCTIIPGNTILIANTNSCIVLDIEFRYNFVTIYCCYDIKRNRVRDKSLILTLILSFFYGLCYVCSVILVRIEFMRPSRSYRDGFWGYTSASKLYNILTTLHFKCSSLCRSLIRLWISARARG